MIFVDEAYQLASDRDGKKVLDFILPLAESLTTEYGEHGQQIIVLKTEASESSTY